MDTARLLPEGTQLHLVSRSARDDAFRNCYCLTSCRKSMAVSRKGSRRVPDEVHEEVREARTEEADHIDQLSAELGRKQPDGPLGRFVQSGLHGVTAERHHAALFKGLGSVHFRAVQRLGNWFLC